MTINEYQQLAMRTSSSSAPSNLVTNAALGLCGESGEVADLVKKHLFHGHDLDKEHVAKELGDICWYIATCAKGLGYDLETIMQMNVDKLRKRYPDGFDTEKSKNRQANDI